MKQKIFEVKKDLDGMFYIKGFENFPRFKTSKKANKFMKEASLIKNGNFKIIPIFYNEILTRN